MVSSPVPVPAMRTDFACANAAGKAGPRQVQVVADRYAWNEAKPGVDGNPVPNANVDRALELFLHGCAKR